ncbi:Tectonic-3 [Oryzias melastigma]|uniref:Tectonic-3 n=1 Tax=Oryzias melastigma TaxID=30732 RepID=A0A834FIA5_ORYME|nr:Tectonic-3 [Oryzias melastigma]
MNISLFPIFAVLCARLLHAATELGLTSAVSNTPANVEPLNTGTPAPAGTTESVTAGLTEGVSRYPTPDSTVTSTISVSESASVFTEAPTATTVQTTTPPLQGCLCDLTTDFCDIGCCCDTTDCGVANLSSVFRGCLQAVIPGVCIEKWLMFKANVDSRLVTVTDSLFCVQNDTDVPPKSLPAVTERPVLGDSFHFSAPGQTFIKHERDFYRVDDVIQTYFLNSSVRSVLRQPSAGTAVALCINRNPAKFLRSASSSCSRLVTPDSCSTDPNLSSRSYFSDLNLIKVIIPNELQAFMLLIPVVPQADWPAPTKQNNSCTNVVRKVTFVIGYTGSGEIEYASVSVDVVDVGLDQLFLQTHSVHFQVRCPLQLQILLRKTEMNRVVNDLQLATPSPTSGRTKPAVGLKVGSTVNGRFNGVVQSVTSLGLSTDGECSSDLSGRMPVLFTHNTISGCKFTSPANNCSQLRSQMYQILQGSAAPDVIAMNSGSQPDWTRLVVQECPASSEESCELGCILPNSLSIQVLWARQGLLDLPQNYILGAKYMFQCQTVKCPVSSLTLTTKVTFTETTVYPEAPRGLPQPHWKFPFDFFGRGSAELDGHFVSGGSSSWKEVKSLILLTVMLLTGLGFYSR